VDAGDSGGREHPCEAFFSRGGFQRHAVKQELVARDRQQKARFVI
jgi:hypothetical protein